MPLPEKEGFASRRDFREKLRNPTDPTPGMTGRRYNPREKAALGQIFKNPFFVSKRHYIKKIQTLESEKKLAKDPETKKILENKIKFLKQFRMFDQ